MGLIIFPVLLFAIVTVIIAILFIISAIRQKIIHLKEFIAGVLITASIYAILFANYKYSNSVYALGTYFVFPFFMILLPATLGSLARLIKKDTFISFSNSLFISVCISGLFITVFNKYTFGLANYLEIPVYY